MIQIKNYYKRGEKDKFKGSLTLAILRLEEPSAKKDFLDLLKSKAQKDFLDSPEAKRKNL